MRRDPLEVLIAEAERLSAKLRDLDEDAWSLPTACEPWTVRELLGHIAVTISWLPGMLHSPAPVPTDPADPLVSARDYYRPDPRFSLETNSRRIELGREYAARSGGNGATALAMFEHEWRRAAAMCAAEPEGRVVRTRHGDAMLLNDFLVTRVVEVAVHGMDLAAAVHSEPWLTASAADLLMVLLAGDEGAEQVRQQLGWEPAAFVAKATGRAPVSDAERAELDRLGIHWLTLG
ncbi:maleylpyruvate isomerase N-terminal domain-containing protein [Actinospica robiniae]|uniref:maleylpyruvate isomerase N-terminal domain-containing protein n=1 Tax=Actinospica robiniae TaxID=304901 RepID=UPI0004091F0A|nr:maleylpyruvate isomerase N-terminal domain-containing protein [Actinospica robiniae]